MYSNLRPNKKYSSQWVRWRLKPPASRLFTPCTGLTHAKLVSLTSPCCSGLASRDLRYSALQLLGESGACGLLNRVFRRRSKKTSKLRVTGLCEGNSPVTGEFPAQRASNAESVSIWWHLHAVASSVHFTWCLVNVRVQWHTNLIWHVMH